VDDTVVTALESAIADLGTLLVQVDKFRAGRGDDARALRAVCLAIGDRAVARTVTARSTKGSHASCTPIRPPRGRRSTD